MSSLNPAFASSRSTSPTPPGDHGTPACTPSSLATSEQSQYQDHPLDSPMDLDSEHEVRHMDIYCCDLCQFRSRHAQHNRMMATWMTPPCCPNRGLSCQFKPKIKPNLKPTLNPMRPQLPSYMDALFAETNSVVCKTETDTLNPTFRIRFFAHSRVVPGRVVVNRISKNTGGKDTRRLVKFM
jgi:hypothetical protein